jgi:hypothetical protein
MQSLLTEMKSCKSTQDCFEVATTDAYGEEEQAVGWLTCIETMFDKFDHVTVLDQQVELDGFDLANERAVVAICRKGRKKTKIALESVEFPKLSLKEELWLKAYAEWSHVA